jgi:uncharacterized protein (UPF0210 family)
MIDQKDILATIKMIESQKLDIRTITMGISLFDCVSDDLGRCTKNIYDKITRLAEKLVDTGNDIENEFGIPIVNKRISVTPISLISQSCGHYAEFAKTLDSAAKEVGVDFIGGYSAFCQKAATSGEQAFIESIPEALASTDIVCSSVNVATTRAGINMDAVRLMGGIIKDAARLTAGNNGYGATKLVVFANAVEDNPFMAGAFPMAWRGRLCDKRGRIRPGGGKGRAGEAKACRSTMYPSP